MNLSCYTSAELLTILMKIWRRTYRDLTGGGLYGMDWPAFSLLFPHRASVYRAVRDEWRSRPHN